MSDLISSPSRAPKVGFVSLGCPKALTDSELILTQLTRRDALLVLGAIDILLRRLDSRLGGVLGADSLHVFVRPTRNDPHEWLLFQDWLTQKVAACGDERGRLLAGLHRNAGLPEFA